MRAARPLTAEEMAVAEQNAVALGVTLDALMENAGRAVAEEAARHLPPPPAPVAVVASTGNNGGDGSCAAHYLKQWGYAPSLWIVRPPSEIRSEPARRCFERIERHVPIHVGVPSVADLEPLPLAIDALLGTGQTGALHGPIQGAVEVLRKSRVPVLSIDEPTGVADPSGLEPRWTVALSAVKSEMDPTRAGELVVRDIGIPDEAWRCTGPGDFLFFPSPEAMETTGRTGRVVVIGGGPYSGAPGLAAMAALRSGAERATILAPESVVGALRSFSPNLVVESHGSDRFRPTDVEEILAFVRTRQPSAVVLGMGAGAHPDTVEALSVVERELVGTLPLVVDADGLAGLPSAEQMVERGPRPVLIATPNTGEFERYLGGPRGGSPEERSEAARRAASARHLFLVVKGPVDVLTDGTDVFENRHHHVAMTVGGCGDVLGGVLGSLLAQGVSPLGAARLGTRWVGEAGIRAATRRGMGLVATDLLDEIPAALVDGMQRVRPAG